MFKIGDKVRITPDPAKWRGHPTWCGVEGVIMQDHVLHVLNSRHYFRPDDKSLVPPPNEGPIIVSDSEIELLDDLENWLEHVV